MTAACADCGAPLSKVRYARCRPCRLAYQQAHARIARCEACGAPLGDARRRWCQRCYLARRAAGLGTHTYVRPAPPETDSGPARCGACGLVFAAPIVRSAHTYWCTGRCLAGWELALRGWRCAGGVWQFPAPDTGRQATWARRAAEEVA